MKDIRCIFGRHDWTQWRRPSTKDMGEVGKTLIAPNIQYRRCKRCGKRDMRPVRTRVLAERAKV